MAKVFDQDERKISPDRFTILETAINSLADWQSEQDNRISELEQQLKAERQARIAQGDALYDLAANG
jgi:hypothetical protein